MPPPPLAQQTRALAVKGLWPSSPRGMARREKPPFSLGRDQAWGQCRCPTFPASLLWSPLPQWGGGTRGWYGWEFLRGFSRTSRNTGQLLSMSSGLHEITRKEVVAWNLQAKGRMLLRKSMNCLSYHLPMDHRGWVGQGKGPEEVSVGTGTALFVDRWTPATTPEAEERT